MNENATILVLDDDPDICTMIKLMLEYHGFTVYTADTQSRMEMLLAENKIDLVIMDMLLSGVNGADICRKLKNDPQKLSLPIIMLSAHPNAHEDCLAAGADDFLGKPFEMDELVKKIRKNLKKINQPD